MEKNTEIISAVKYNLNNIPKECDHQVKNRFASLNSRKCKSEELRIETRDNIKEEYKTNEQTNIFYKIKSIIKWK